jgi:hypothetical protein
MCIFTLKWSLFVHRGALGLGHGELSLPPPSILLLLPLLNPDSHPSILGADAILVSICAARCFNLHSCHPRLTSSCAKAKKDAGDGMASAELAVCIMGDEKFWRSAQLEHQHFDSIWLKTREVEHCNAF